MRQKIESDNQVNGRYLSLLSFRLGQQEYALPVSDVVQIVEMVIITALPQTIPTVPGVINYRGDIVPVLDLRLRFGLPFQSYGLHTHIILADVGSHLLGLIVDSVEVVLNVDVTEIEQEHLSITARAQTAPHSKPYIAGLAKVNRQIIPIVSVTALLSEPEQQQLQEYVDTTPEIVYEQ